MTTKTAFEQLVDGVDELVKANTGGESIGAGAGAESVAGGAGADAVEGAAAADAGAELGKSFTIKLEDGTEIPAVDGTELVKALTDRVEAVEAGAVKMITGLMNVVKEQGSLLKAQAGQIDVLSKAGVGRKAVLAIHEKPAATSEELAKAAGADKGVTSETFLAKAMAMNTAGKLGGREVAEIEAYINLGQQPPAHLVSAVLEG